MMRKVILYIAMSMDGYIAGKGDDLSFLDGFDHLSLVQSSYAALMDSIDTIIMGRRTYDWILSMSEWPYTGYQSYVLTSKPMASSYATLTQETPKEIINRLNHEQGKDIWLVGGGKLVQSMLKSDLIDEIVLAYIPVILGDGIPLFNGVYKKFTLTGVEHEGGLILATYTK
ncbi:MAG: dihydrofolate reductase family protein [Acholeplasmataceae bacterium]